MKNSNTITAEQSVGTSILVSFSDIILNIVVAAITGSVVMLAQALQGLADLTTALLLLIGVKRSKRKPDVIHPLGFGREVFFWSLLASIFVFGFTGLFAVVRGLQQIADPGEIELPLLAAAMLVFGFITNSFSMRVSLKRLGTSLQTTDVKSVLRRIMHSSFIETKSTLLVDGMGTLSALIGMISITFYVMTGSVLFDGLGAVMVGIMTMCGALLLITNVKELLIGISPHSDTVNAVRKSALSVRHVQDVLDMSVLTIGSGNLFVVLEVHFNDGLTTDEIEQITDEIKAKVRADVPAVHKIQVEAETPE